MKWRHGEEDVEEEGRVRRWKRIDGGAEDEVEAWQTKSDGRWMRWSEEGGV